MAVLPLRSSNFDDGGNRFPGYAEAVEDVVPGHVVRDQPKNGASALGLQRVLGLGSYQTAWAWLHKLRRAMVRPGRDHLAGWIEVDETYVGGWEEGMKGRRRGEKSLIVIAAQVEGSVIGRIRMRLIPDASAGSLHRFYREQRGARQHDPHRWMARICEYREEGLCARNLADPRPSPGG